MHTLQVATRKGLFAVRRDAAGWPLGAPHFPGEPVSQVLADPRDGAWYAALRLGHFGVKIKRSADQGATWEEVATPAFPPKPAEGPWHDDPTPWTLDMVWSLEAGGARLWAGGGCRRDCSTRKTAARAGTWSPACGSGPTGATGSAAATTTPASIRSWSTRATTATSASPSPAPACGRPGTAARAGPTPRTAWTPAPTCRRSAVARSFLVHGAGLPERDAYHLVYRHALACAADGETLAMGSTTGGLWVSEDGGGRWQCLSRDLPPIAAVRFAG